MGLVEKAAAAVDKAKREQEKWSKILLEQRKKQHQKNLENAGNSLIFCGFGLDREDLHIGCMLYALEAMKENPELEEQLKAKGAAVLVANKKCGRK